MPKFNLKMTNLLSKVGGCHWTIQFFRITASLIFITLKCVQQQRTRNLGELLVFPFDLFIYQISFDIKQKAALSFSHFLQPSVWLFLRFFNVDRFIILRWCFATIQFHWIFADCKHIPKFSSVAAQSRPSPTSVVRLSSSHK